MQYKVELKAKALKFLKSLSGVDKQRIEKRIQELSIDPRNEHVIKLTDQSNQYRARQGDYRILFSIYDDKLIVEVIDIDRRKDVYR